VPDCQNILGKRQWVIRASVCVILNSNPHVNPYLHLSRVVAIVIPDAIVVQTSSRRGMATWAHSKGASREWKTCSGNWATCRPGPNLWMRSTSASLGTRKPSEASGVPVSHKPQLYSFPSSHPFSMRSQPPAQDDCKRIEDRSALTAAPSTPLSLFPLPSFKLWTRQSALAATARL